MRLANLAVCGLVVAALLGLAGCGSGNGGGSGPVLDPSRFAGTYNGTYVTRGQEAETATLSLSIASDGTFTGTSHSTTFSDNGTVTGTITGAGAMTSSYNYQGRLFMAQGTVSLSGAGYLAGTITQVSGGGSGVLEYRGTLTLDVIRQ